MKKLHHFFLPSWPVKRREGEMITCILHSCLQHRIILGWPMLSVFDWRQQNPTGGPMPAGALRTVIYSIERFHIQFSQNCQKCATG